MWRVRHPPVDDVGIADAALHRVGAGAKLGDHARADAVMRDPVAKFGGGETRHETGRIVHVLEQTGGGGEVDDLLRRSEEHTSELQSLMRLSYAVFCLKKKK